MSELHHVVLNLDEHGMGSVAVDGVEQRGVRATKVFAEAGSATTVQLEHVLVDVTSEVKSTVRRVVVMSGKGEPVYGEGASLVDALRDVADALEGQA